MKKYTLGVAYDKKNVILIRKTKPEWQAGRLNFVGGKIEQDEKPLDCIRREFREETGVDIHTWRYVGRMAREDDFECFIYAANSDLVAGCKTTTEEEIIVTTHEAIRYSSGSQFISNIKTIYEFVMSEDFWHVNAEINIAYPKNKP